MKTILVFAIGLMLQINPTTQPKATLNAADVTLACSTVLLAGFDPIDIIIECKISKEPVRLIRVTIGTLYDDMPDALLAKIETTTSGGRRMVELYGPSNQATLRPDAYAQASRHNAAMVVVACYFVGLRQVKGIELGVKPWKDEFISDVSRLGAPFGGFLLIALDEDLKIVAVENGR